MSGDEPRPSAATPASVVEWQGGIRARFARRLTSAPSGVPGLLGAALAPAELLFRAAAALHHAAYDSGLRRPVKLPLPVVSIGNLAVGGSGKTPVTAWVAERLARAGLRPGILHGGYADDEPALHRRWHPNFPVLARRDRVRAARQAIALGATALVLDDAFQHRSIARDLDIVLVAAERWTPRPHLLPRGPWRESPAALRRADVVVVTRKTATSSAAARVAAAVERHAPGAVVAVLALTPTDWVEWHTGERRASPPPGVGVAAIAEPAMFAAQAQQVGARLSRFLAYADHHAYGPEDAAHIAEAAEGGVVLTTAKDAVKLQALSAEVELWVLGQQVIGERGSDRLARALDALAPSAGVDPGVEDRKSVH